MIAASKVVVKTPDSDFVLVREFAAPRDLVWKAWTDVGMLAQWWGPEMFTNPRCRVDLKPGGEWVVVMHGPAGSEFDQDYPVNARLLEIDPPRRLLMVMGTEDHPDDWQKQFDAYRADGAKGKAMTVSMEVLLEELGPRRTRLTMRQRFPSAVERDANMKMGALEGWSGSFLKLDRLVA